MIIEELAWTGDSAGDEWSAQFRPGATGAGRRVRVEAPAGVLGPAGDASGWASLGLWPAILDREDLTVDGAVDEGHLARLTRASFVLGSWMPGMRQPGLTAQQVRAAAARRAAGVGAFFSRGVDSMYEAARAATDRRPLTHLVFVDGLEPVHSTGTATSEIEEARGAAALLDLPLLVVRTDARLLTEGRRDWADVHGSVLAGLGTMLGGALGTVVIPSTDSYATLVPYGSHPLLDPLFSTSTVRVEHGDLAASRVAKVAALVSQRPDLLPSLKVCFAEDRVDNCGRCGKCLITMACLVAAGGLGHATGFPPELDLDLVRAIRPAPLQSRQHWTELLRSLDATGREPALRAAVAHALRRAARPDLGGWRRILRDRAAGRRPTLHPSWKDPSRGLDWAHHTEIVRLIDEGGSGTLAFPALPLPDLLRRPAAGGADGGG